MLVTMSDVLWVKFEAKEIVVKILDSLQKQYSSKKTSTASRMKSRTLVRDHVTMMTNYFTEAELHGAEIDQVMQIGIILNSLSLDFIQFNSNYIMNKLNYSVSQLLNKLQTFESISKLGKQMASVNIIDRPSFLKSRSVKKFAKRKVSAPKRKATKHNPKV